MNLAKTQDMFTAALQTGVHVSKSDSVRAMDCENMICENPRIPPDLALRIYANNVSGARVKALTLAYPACVRILGAACFEGIAHHFSDATPSMQPDLNIYGATFADFLADHIAVMEEFSDYQYLGDLARLERLCHVAYYASDETPFDFDKLGQAGNQAPESLRLKLAESIGLLRSVYPVLSIREVNLADGDAASVPAGALPEHLVVWRAPFHARVERVDSATFDLLTALDDGYTLGEIVERMPEQADTLSDAVPRLIQRGWISGVADISGVVEKSDVVDNRARESGTA